MQFGATWSCSVRWSKCWSPSAKNTPSISLNPPGCARIVSASARARSAPNPIASVRMSASRPTVARWTPRCVTPLAPVLDRHVPDMGAVADHDLGDGVRERAREVGDAYRSMNVTDAFAPTTISVCGKTAAPSASRYVSVCSGRSICTPSGTYRNVPPVRNAPCIAVNFVRSVGTSECRWRSTRSGCVAAAASRSVNTTPLLASAGSRCVSIASELCWISRPDRSPIAPAAASTSPGTSSRFAARPPGVYGAKSSSNPDRSV